MGARQSQSTKGGGNASLAALDRLGGEARELAQLAAVIGRSRRQPITLCYWRAAGNTIVTSLAPLEAMQSDAVEPEIIAQHYTAAELPEHGGDDIDLLAVEDFTQMFATEPGGRCICWWPGRPGHQGRPGLQRTVGCGP